MTEDTPLQSPIETSNQNEQKPPLFYSAPEPIVRGGHRDFKIRPERDFSFAAKTNTIPITTPEFSFAARHYPIIMLGKDLVPTVAVGLRPDRNLFLNEDGTWETGAYVPAYVRRYPFILLGKESDERLQLGVDAAGRSEKAGARPLFQGEEEAETIKQAMDMCEQFHQAYMFTAEFAKVLGDAGIVEDRSLEVETSPGEKTNLGSFKAVNEDKFRDLPDKTFLDWRKKGYLHGVYFHLQSMNNWDTIMMKASQQGELEQASS